MNTTTTRTTSFAIIVFVVALFFLWGGITSLNDILIPKLKGLFQLSYAQAMLTQFAFFGAYAIVSLPAGALVARLGYGRGIVAGLAVMAAACLLFLPAANVASYNLILLALFVLAGGITILQVAANPLIANLGSAETSHSRLTLAQAFNALGTAIWPYVGAQIILGSVAKTDPATLFGNARTTFEVHEVAVVGHTYLGIALVLATLAAVFWLARRRFGDADASANMDGSIALLQRARLRYGVASIFLYVGAEVTIGSFLVNYLMQSSTLGLDQQTAGKRLALYWGGAMIGRFIGAGILYVTKAPGKVLAVAAIGAASLVLFSSLSGGPLAGWTLLAVGITNAIMFPTIFSLAVEGLGDKTPQGSGLLCMAIVGGAIIPLISGKVADMSSIATALVIPVLCYLLIAAYGWSARKPAQPLSST